MMVWIVVKMVWLVVMIKKLRVRIRIVDGKKFNFFLRCKLVPVVN